jgi:hypothetical protein
MVHRQRGGAEIVRPISRAGRLVAPCTESFTKYLVTYTQITCSSNKNKLLSVSKLSTQEAGVARESHAGGRPLTRTEQSLTLNELTDDKK